MTAKMFTSERTVPVARQKILVVDDDENTCELIRMQLDMAGFDPVCARDGREALAAAREHRPSLMILDLVLPEVDGIEVFREVRRNTNVPVIMVTARSDEFDRVLGLEMGADDYVTKPFNPRALVARVKAILRRTDGTAKGGRPIEVGSLRIDPRRREASVGERPMELRSREFDLLAALARDPGVVLTREALLEDVWGTDFPGETRTVDVHVAELRKKLGPDGPQVETIRGLGYRLVPPPRGTGSSG
jgi:DNA-binding response OmpR family regulator